MAKKGSSPAQRAAQKRLSAAAKQASREGKKGKAFQNRVSQILGGKGSKTTKKKSNPKKKATKKKNNPKKNNNPGGSKTAKGVDLTSPSEIAKLYAVGGIGIYRAGLIGQGRDAREQGGGVVNAYTGFNPNTGEANLKELWRGYGGIGNDLAYRKFARAMGFKAYPDKNPKNFSQFLDYVTMFGAPALHAQANKDDPVEGHRRAYESLYGVDLGTPGFASWQPAEMLQTKLPYTLKKVIFKVLRDNNVKIKGFI